MIAAFFRKHWFFAGIVLVVLCGYGLGDAHVGLQEYHILPIGIFTAFLITGLTLDTSRFGPQLLQLKAPLAAMISSLGFIPLLACLLARTVFPLEYVIGVCIIATAPVTVVSGTVMTDLGRGNVPLSLFICVLGNFIGIFTIPFSLKLLIGGGADVNLPAIGMLSNLAITVLVPIVLGHLVQSRLKARLSRFSRAFSIFQQCIVLLIIFNAVAVSGPKIREAGTMLPLLLAFVIFLHALILTMNYGISKAIGLDRPSTTAFTLHTSQKTLAVCYLVWSGYFANSYPLALIPGIVYHLTQMIMDTFVAERFRRHGA
ncbi:MAG: bile acid:sodium symporter family protein [Hyphomicrobiales bacterium]